MPRRIVRGALWARALISGWRRCRDRHDRCATFPGRSMRYKGATLAPLVRRAAAVVARLVGQWVDLVDLGDIRRGVGLLQRHRCAEPARRAALSSRWRT